MYQREVTVIEGSFYQGIVPPEILPCALLALLFLAAVYDWLYQRIPNRLVLVGLLVALAFRFLFYGGSGVVDALVGMLTGFTLLLPFYVMGGMAAGDVKLMTMVGAFLGPQFTFFSLLGSFLVGGVWAGGVVTRKRMWKQVLHRPLPGQIRHAPGRQQGGDHLPPPESGSVETGGVASAIGHLPYGVVIALGTLVVQLLRWPLAGA